MQDDLLTPELEARLKTNYARIAEDETLTSALSDVEARELLAWAQAEMRRLVAQTTELSEADAEAALTAKVAHLRRHLRRLAKDSANDADPTTYLKAHLAPPIYPEDTAAPGAASAALTFAVSPPSLSDVTPPSPPPVPPPPPVPTPQRPPAVVPEAPDVPPAPLPVSEPSKPRSPLASVLRHWLGKKNPAP